MQGQRRWQKGFGAAAATAALCAVLAAAAPPGGADASGGEPPDCDADARLSVELHGGVSTTVEWDGASMICEGMPRPEGEGGRLRLAGPDSRSPGETSLAFILGIPGLEAGRTAHELPTNVTLIEEGAGRFYSTRDTDGCFTDVDSQEPVDGGPVYRIAGVVYCLSPLAGVNIGGAVSFTELRFKARIDWTPPE